MSERVSVGSWPRRTLAGWLRALADRLAPQREITVRLQADDTAFRQAMENAEQQLRRATQSRVRRQPQWPDPPDREGWARVYRPPSPLPDLDSDR